MRVLGRIECINTVSDDEFAYDLEYSCVSAAIAASQWNFVLVMECLPLRYSSVFENVSQYLYASQQLRDRLIATEILPYFPLRSWPCT
jgi:hypothetical protein